MYERFTDRARKVMQLANREAQRFNHEYIGTEHILIGLCREGAGVAAEILRESGATPDRVILEVEQIIQHGLGGEYAIDRRPHTPWAIRVLQAAVEEARNFGHNWVGTEHLLLGLIRADQSVAAQVLMGFDLTLEGVRAEVKRRNSPSQKPVTPILAENQKQAIEELIRDLSEQKERFVAEQEFDQAARCRDGADTLKRFLKRLG